MRVSTEGLAWKRPIVLFCRNGAVDQTLTSDAGRVKPRPPPGSGYGEGAPVTGWRTVIVPTDGSSLYDADEKLSQMSPAVAFVAIGLQTLVCIRVEGMRSSLDR